MRKEEESIGRGLGLAARVGTEFVAATAVGAFFGYLLDRFLGTWPWLLILGMFLGLAAGMLNVYRLAQRTSEEEREKEQKEP